MEDNAEYCDVGLIDVARVGPKGLWPPQIFRKYSRFVL